MRGVISLKYVTLFCNVFRILIFAKNTSFYVLAWLRSKLIGLFKNTARYMSDLPKPRAGSSKNANLTEDPTHTQLHLLENLRNIGFNYGANYEI